MLRLWPIVRVTISYAVVGVISLWSHVSQALTLDEVKDQGFITVAIYQNLPPYSYSENGTANGIDIDLAKAIAKGLEVNLRLQWVIADENLDDDLRNHIWKGHYLRRKQVADVMLRVPYDRAFAYKVDHEGIVINDTVHMFGPYQQESWAIAHDRVQMPKLETLARLQYDKVGVEIDTLPDFFLTGVYGGRIRSQVQHYPSTQVAIEAMANSQVAAVMGTNSQVQWGIKQITGDFGVHTRLTQTLSKPTWDVGMAVKDANRKLAYAITDIIDAMVKSGAMEELFQSYGVTYEKPQMYR